MKKIFCFIFLIYCLSSCGFGGSAIYDSEKISPGLKKRIAVLNDKFCNATANKDKDALRNLFSPLLLKKVDLDVFFQQIGNFSMSGRLQVVDEFRTKGIAKASVLIPSGMIRTGDFLIHFTPITNESYVSIVKLKGERDYYILLAFIYGKYNDEWKINYFYMGDYSFSGQAAPYYYKKAKEEYDNGNLVNAVVNIDLANTLLNPGGDIFVYNIKKDAEKLTDKIYSTTSENYKLPMIVDKVDTKPEIFNIHGQEIEGAFVPMVNYLTSIDLDDTIRLKRENEEVRKVIPQYFKGINDNEFVCYRAYNEMPRDSVSVTRYGFVHTIK